MIVVERPRFLAGDALGGDNPFSRRHMRELRMSGSAERDDVADRGNAGHVGSVLRVDLDVSLLHLQTDAFRVESRRHGPAAGGDQQVVGAHSLRAAVAKLDVDVHAVSAHVCGGHAGTRVARDALLAERFFELGGHAFVLHGHQSRQQLDDRHVAAEAAEDRCELDPDSAAAHDRDRPGHVAQTDRLVARNDAFAVDLDARDAARRRTRRDDDLLPRAQRLLLAFEHIDPAVARQACRPLDPVDFVFLEQELDALRQARDDPVLSRLNQAHVDADGPLP